MLTLNITSDLGGNLVPRQKRRYMNIDRLVEELGIPEVLEEDKEEVQIIFRAPRLLKKQVQQAIKEGLYPSANVFYEEASWKLLLNHNYAREFKEELEDQLKDMLIKLKNELGIDVISLRNELRKLINQLSRVSEPLIMADASLRESVIKIMEHKQEKIKALIVYYVAYFREIKKELLIRKIKFRLREPEYLIENSILSALNEGLIREVKKGVYELTPLGEFEEENTIN